MAARAGRCPALEGANSRGKEQAFNPERGTKRAGKDQTKYCKIGSFKGVRGGNRGGRRTDGKKEEQATSSSRCCCFAGQRLIVTQMLRIAGIADATHAIRRFTDTRVPTSTDYGACKPPLFHQFGGADGSFSQDTTDNNK